MQPTSQGFERTIDVSPGLHQYKFFINCRKWCYDVTNPLCKDDKGNINNFVEFAVEPTSQCQVREQVLSTVSTAIVDSSVKTEGTVESSSEDNVAKPPPRINKKNEVPKPKEKLKILALHGYRQTAVLFQKRLSSSKILTQKDDPATCTFVMAPHFLEGRQKSQTEGYPAGSGWCVITDEEEDDHLKWPEIENYKGLEESIDNLRSVWETQGPFDGILGFSQGGLMASILCHLQNSEENPFPKFKFAIFIGSYIPSAEPWKSLYKKTCKIPTLHIFGKQDLLISSSSSQEHAACFENAEIWEHPGGHFIPNDKNKIINQFVAKFA